jgi:hypothetical protein
MVQPAVEFVEDLSSQQRAAIVMYHLGTLGHCYTTEEIAALVGLTYRGALYLMDKMSGIERVPVVKVDGKWMILPGG